MAYNIDDNALPLYPASPNGPPETGQDSTHHPNNPLPKIPNSATDVECRLRAALDGEAGGDMAAKISLGTDTSYSTVAQSPLSIQSFAGTSPSTGVGGNEHLSVTPTAVSDQVSLSSMKEWTDKQDHLEYRYQSNPPHHSAQTVNPYGYHEHDVPNPFRANPFNVLPPNTWHYSPVTHHEYSAPPHSQFSIVPQTTSRENPFRHLNRPVVGLPRAHQPNSYYAPVQGHSPNELYAGTITTHNNSQHNQDAPIRKVQLQAQPHRPIAPSIPPPTQIWTVTPSLSPRKQVSLNASKESGDPSLANNFLDIQHTEDKLKSVSSQNQKAYGNNYEASRQHGYAQHKELQTTDMLGAVTDPKPKVPQECRKRNHSPETSSAPPPPTAPYFRDTDSLDVAMSEDDVSKEDHIRAYYRHTHVESLRAAPKASSPKPKPPPTNDNLSQAIVSDHHDYTWPVQLYKVDVADAECKLAKDWLDDQLSALDFEITYKWFVHATEGFLKDGDHLSFVVLHNAVDPFEYSGYSTTTTFGYYDSSPDEITWKTIMPSLHSVVKQWADQGFIRQVRLWHPGMKATEKRFHRAYWLAANMLPIGGLLNRAKPSDEPIQLREMSRRHHAKIYSDVTNIDTVSDTPEFDDTDVTNQGIDISMAESNEIWLRCLEESSSDLASIYRPSSVGLGSSEWVH